MYPRVTRPRRSVSVNCDASQISLQKKELEEIPSGTETNGGSRPIDIKRGELPLRSDFEKSSPQSETQDSLHFTPESEEAISSPSPLLDIKFGTYRPAQPLTNLLLPAKDDKPDSGVSTTLGSLLGVPGMKKEKKEKSSEEKMK